MVNNDIPSDYRRVLGRKIILRHETLGVHPTLHAEFTQHDIMKIMKYVKPYNIELYNKLRMYIDMIDFEYDEFTDFKRKLPKRILFR